jgi:hypothetical protein
MISFVLFFVGCKRKEQLGSKTERRLPLAKEPQGLIASFSWSN